MPKNVKYVLTIGAETQEFDSWRKMNEFFRENWRMNLAWELHKYVDGICVY